MMKFRFQPCKEISIFGDDGALKAVVTIDPPSRFANFPDAVSGATKSRSLINFLRNVPSDWGVVWLKVVATNTINPINRSSTMNVLDQLDKDKKDQEQLSDLPQRFICPAPAGSTIPKDGVLEYATIEKLADLLQADGANVVYMFSDDKEAELKCLVEYFELFGYAPVILTGIPDVVYSPKFENLTWSLPRAAYHATINDLVEFKRKAEMSKAEEQQSTIYGKEQARITRKSGEVKRFTAFDAPQVAGELDPHESADTPV